MNYKAISEYIQSKISDFIGDRNAIIGISGGIDSAVVAALCVNAIGSKRCYGIMMPYGDQSVADSKILIDFLKMKDNAHLVNIKPAVDAMFGSIAFKNKCSISKLALGNARARMRMNILYAFACECNGMVIGTSNKTEVCLGYFTKYGDGGVDLEPIADLYKIEIFELAKYLRLPEVFITKAPSAELWEGQTDEGEIGMTYAEMDAILASFMNGEGFEKHGENGNKILKRVINSAHKRVMPHTIVLESFR